MHLFDEPKIDGHCHIIDPQRFPYALDVRYRPQGQEIGDQETFQEVMACHGVRHALLVGPNSGYNFDNRCLLHAIATGQGRFKGVAVVRNDIDIEALVNLKGRGIVGVAINIALNGPEYYSDLPALLQKLEALDLWAQIQVERDQLVEIMPSLERSGVKLMVDHCGRPAASAGLAQAGFQTLLALGREGRAVVKLSGEAKFSEHRFPFDDTRPFVDALVNAFGLERCIWASDWPYLKAPFRLDYGPMLKRWEQAFSPAERRKIMWENPAGFFGFDMGPHGGGLVATGD